MKHLLKYLFLPVFLFSTSPSRAQSSGYPLLDTLLFNTLDSMKIVLNAKSLSAAIQFPDTAV